jgi:hypothetical protein
MKGIELTQNSSKKGTVWVPLTSIVLVQPYIGFDEREDGSEVMLNNSTLIHVAEPYGKVVERLIKL